MSTYQELLAKAQAEDTERRIEHWKKYTDVELAMIVNSQVADIRDVNVARMLLKQHGVKGLPEL